MRRDNAALYENRSLAPDYPARAKDVQSGDETTRTKAIFVVTFALGFSRRWHGMGFFFVRSLSALCEGTGECIGLCILCMYTYLLTSHSSEQVVDPSFYRGLSQAASRSTVVPLRYERLIKSSGKVPSNPNL